MSTEIKSGQGSERVPQWIPGWYRRRECAPEAGLVEAVRYMGGDFPIGFLRSYEAVHPARPPQRGVCIGNARHSELELAVPPDWWIVRWPDGELFLASPAEFPDGFVREEACEWHPPRERDVLPEDVALEVRWPEGKTFKEAEAVGEVRATEHRAMSDRAPSTIRGVTP